MIKSVFLSFNPVLNFHKAFDTVFFKFIIKKLFHALNKECDERHQRDKSGADACFLVRMVFRFV